MAFFLTDAQLAFQAEIREFVEKEIAPGATRRDETEDEAGTRDILMNKMAPRGWMGLTFPRAYGGMGLTAVDLALANIEIAKYDISIAGAFAVQHSLGSVPILQYGTEEQKRRYMPDLASGRKICAFAITESNAGSDAAMQETTAELRGSDYVLNGKKIYITNADAADIYIVMAMTDKSRGARGISAFVVEKGTPGFTFGPPYRKMGVRAAWQRPLIFENCRVPGENLLGKEGEGFKIAMKALDVGRLCVAADGAGLAMGALERATAYAKERYQFGKPIGANEGISFMLADMATQAECARLITLEACALCDAGEPFSMYAAMAKLFATDTAMKAATDAVQIFGGKGYLLETGVERLMRDAKILQIYEGTNQVQRMVISGSLLR